AGGIAGNREAYEYLAASIGSFPSGRAMEDLLCANGFVSATTRPLTGGISSLYQARKTAPISE
ncbi:MAG: class I SAM-dependent methyltransferase, partial [Verrucomicrobiota bacterium]